MLPHIQSLESIFEKIQVDVLRDDLLVPFASGNKWRKLKYNLKYAIENRSTVISFGGAFSNHIHALAGACQHYHLPCVGIIRGEYDIHNPTLKYAASCGMKLHFVSRSDYRLKESSPAIKKIIDHYDDGYLVPEGGTNDLAYKGLAELGAFINTLDHDVVMVAAGTGGTATGLLRSLDTSKELWVFSALKGGHLYDEIGHKSQYSEVKWRFFGEHHLGGFAKTNEDFITWINAFIEKSNVPIDPIYNGKLMYAFWNMLLDGVLDNKKKYLWIHTGGIQGIKAFNYMTKGIKIINAEG